MIVKLDWPCLPLELRTIDQRIVDNLDRLSYQDGYTAEQRYAGLWSWPEQSLDADRIAESTGYQFEPHRLHLQWIKQPGIRFHSDRDRTYSALAVLTQPHLTLFRKQGRYYSVKMQPYHWYLFDHTISHAVLNLTQDRRAICIDFTGLYSNFDLLAASLCNR